MVSILNSPYATYVDSLTPEDRRDIAHIKRFLECWMGDKVFRDDVELGERSLGDLAAERGAYLDDIDTIRPLFDPDYTQFRLDATRETWRLTAIWDEYHKMMLSTLGFYTWAGSSKGYFSEFDEWRDAQILRTYVDVGIGATYLTHPPIAFEISDGCSVGCWFCGISAKKFGGHYEYDERGAANWRATLEAARSVLGDAMMSGFCYWATEPLDHPQYDSFIEDYYDINGVIPQTTSAIPLKNIELTRRVLSIWEKSKHVPNRFSILTTSIMRRVHKEFSAEELFGVELVHQNIGSMSTKSIAGKAYQEGNSTGEKVKKRKDNLEDGTIACVTGFLVNMPKKTLRLVSPTLPNEDWPDGYYVFSSKRFTDPEDMAVKMREMILEQAGRKVSGDKPIQTGSRHWFEVTEEGGYRIRDSKTGYSSEAFNTIAPMMQEGNSSPKEILKQAIIDGHDPIAVMKIMSDLDSMGIIGDRLCPPKGVTAAMMELF